MFRSISQTKPKGLQIQLERILGKDIRITKSDFALTISKM